MLIGPMIDRDKTDEAIIPARSVRLKVFLQASLDVSLARTCSSCDRQYVMTSSCGSASVLDKLGCKMFPHQMNILTRQKYTRKMTDAIMNDMADASSFCSHLHTMLLAKTQAV
jgi:hypothetical protein